MAQPVSRKHVGGKRKLVGRTKTRVKKTDLVEVISGKDAGKRGRVLKVIRDKGRVIVQGVGFVKRHTRPNPQRNIKGGIAEREAPIHLSNVMVISPDDDKRTRIGSKVLPDGRKVRVGRRTGEVLDK
jgi:large subunit ribosomal protein L24